MGDPSLTTPRTRAMRARRSNSWVDEDTPPRRRRVDPEDAPLTPEELEDPTAGAIEAAERQRRSERSSGADEDLWWREDEAASEARSTPDMRGRYGLKEDSSKGGDTPAPASSTDEDMARALEMLDPTPEGREELFRSTPVGPGVIHRTDGTVERTPAAPAEDGTTAPGARRVDIDWGPEFEEPINRVRIDEPVAITASTSSEATGDEPMTPGEADETRRALEALLDGGGGDLAAHEASESPEYEANESPAEEAAEGEVQGTGRGDLADDVFAYSYATDEDPTYPGSLMEEGAPGAQGPGGWADDEDPELPGAMALDAMEPGGSALASPRRPTPAEAPAARKVPDGYDPSRRMDAGLPTEGEIGGATFLDALRWPLHALGSGFLAAAGRSPSRFQSIAGPMRESRNEGLAARADTKAENDRRAGEAVARREGEEADRAALADRLASAERIAAMREAPNDVDRMRAEDAARRTDLMGRRLSLDEAESAREGAEADREAATAADMGDPGSAVSARARQRLEIELAGLPASLRETLLDGRSIDGLSANDVAALEGEGSSAGIPGFARGALGRGRGAAGGGPGGLTPTQESLVQQYIRAGMSEEEARSRVSSMGVTGARTELRGMGPEGRVLDPREIVSGVRVGVELSDGERAALRTDWRETRAAFDALATLERAVNDSSLAERLADPSFVARINPALARLRGMAARIQGSGIINPGELPVINATIPNPSADRVAFGAFVESLAEWRRMAAAQIETGLADYNVDAEGIRRAMSALRSGRRIEGAPSAEARVRVRAPDGRTGSMSRADYDRLTPEQRETLEVVE